MPNQKKQFAHKRDQVCKLSKKSIDILKSDHINHLNKLLDEIVDVSKTEIKSSEIISIIEDEWKRPE